MNIIKQLGIVLLALALFLVPAFNLSGLSELSVNPRADNIYNTPGSTTVEVFDEVGLRSITFEMSASKSTDMYGVCVPNVGLSGKPAADYCRSLGHKDRGCGWDSEVACSCKVTQQGCYGVRENPISQPVKIFYAGQEVGELNQENGFRTTPNPELVAQLTNEFCREAFLINNKKTGHKEECFVPLEFTGGRSDVNIRTSFDSSGFDEGQTIVEIKNYCENGIQDEGEIGIDCGGKCEACTITAVPIPVEDPITKKEEVIEVDFTSIPQEEPLVLPDERTLYVPNNEIIEGKDSPVFDMTRLTIMPMIGLGIVLAGLLLGLLGLLNLAGAAYVIGLIIIVVGGLL